MTPPSISIIETEAHVLEVLGIDETAEGVYRLLLSRYDWGVTEIAKDLDCPERAVESALDQLAELRLLRSSLQDPHRFRAVSPDVGLRLLLQEREGELIRQQHQLVQGRTAVLKLSQECAGANGQGVRHDVEYLHGIDEVQRRLEELAHRCSSECLSFMPGGAQSAASLEASKLLDRDLLDRKVRVQTLYLDSVRNDQATFQYAQWLTELGGEVRTAPTLPVRMVVFDRTAALLPVDPDDTKKGAVLLRGPGMIAALTALFLQIWAAAPTLGTEPEREVDETGLTAQEAELLRLLAQGLTDEMAARRLGVGLRTIRRMMSNLMGRLEARSRFAAGVQAVERGWLA